MRKLPTYLLVVTAMLVGTPCLAAEVSFDGITCQMDIPKALLGRHMPNGRVIDTEKKYSSLTLKNLGGFGLPEDPYFLGTWLICGAEYLILEKPSSSIVMDVLKSSKSYAASRSEIAGCTSASGKQWSTAVILLPVPPGKSPWSVSELWEIDEANLKFRQVRDGSLRCT